MKKFLYQFVFLAVVLAACGPAPTSAPAATVTATEIPTLTETPTSLPTDTATIAPTPPLEEYGPPISLRTWIR